MVIATPLDQSRSVLGFYGRSQNVLLHFGTILQERSVLEIITSSTGNNSTSNNSTYDRIIAGHNSMGNNAMGRNYFEKNYYTVTESHTFLAMTNVWLGTVVSGIYR